MASRNASFPSLDNPVFQFYTPQYYFILLKNPIYRYTNQANIS